MFQINNNKAINFQLLAKIVNDNIVTLDSTLHDGDVVKIRTDASSTPNKDWLNFVKTTQEMLNGDIEYEEAKETLNPITDDFLNDSPEGCDSTTMTLISGLMTTIGTYLEKADNGDEEAIDTVKDNLKDIENEMYKQ